MNLTPIFLAFAVGAQASPPKSNPAGVDLRCGEYCLAVALRALDIASPGVIELESKLGQPGTMGFSMKQLAEAAEKFGAHTLGVDTTLDHLERRHGRFACIALEPTRGHFFCITNVGDGTVTAVNPPQSRVVPRDVFAPTWDGRALLIANAPIDPNLPGRWPIRGLAVAGSILLAGAVGVVLARAGRRRAAVLALLASAVLSPFAAGCDRSAAPSPAAPASPPLSRPAMPIIAVEPATVDLGMMSPRKGSSLQGTFTIRNDGTSPLRLIEGRSTCGCTVPDKLPASLAPGGSMPVSVRVKPKNEVGEQRSSVLISTNNPTRPSISVPIRWREQSVIRVTPPMVDFGWIETGRPIERTVTVTLSPELAEEVWNLETLVPALKTSWETPPTRLDRDHPARNVKIRLEPGAEQGEGAASFTIRDARATYSVRVPVTWKTGPPVEATPQAFFHGRVQPGAAIDHRLVVRSADGGAIRVDRVEVDGKPATIQDWLSQTSTTCSLSTSITAGSTSGIEKHHIQVFLAGHLDDPLTVPVTMIVP